GPPAAPVSGTLDAAVAVALAVVPVIHPLATVRAGENAGQRVGLALRGTAPVLDEAVPHGRVEDRRPLRRVLPCWHLVVASMLPETVNTGTPQHPGDVCWTPFIAAWRLDTPRCPIRRDAAVRLPVSRPVRRLPD